MKFKSTKIMLLARTIAYADGAGWVGSLEVEFETLVFVGHPYLQGFSKYHCVPRDDPGTSYS